MLAFGLLLVRLGFIRAYQSDLPLLALHLDTQLCPGVCPARRFAAGVLCASRRGSAAAPPSVRRLTGAAPNAAWGLIAAGCGAVLFISAL